MRMIGRMGRGLLPLGVAVLALAACSSCAANKVDTQDGKQAADQAQAASVHPKSGLPVIDLTVNGSGAQPGHLHRFRVEVARTGPEQEQGLMFRTAMGPDEGMIFPVAAPRPASFWMKNTVIPLDIVFIGVDGRILNIAVKAIPYDETPLNSKGPVKGVLELNGGRAAQLGIGAGDLVTW